ncbi:MAG TPA: NrfD/PsrC family molybdoenzyme membrane anchor subunit [Myxococcales bacterium]|nr:NrfD/PsrC family molybdoenzyme membrane anchor subunit [Myxococcales bacterium]
MSHDGRNIDPQIGALLGEGAQQRVEHHDAPPHGGYPEGDAPEGTYYGVPALKEPVWKWYVPAYFYVGGVAGASAAAGAAALLLDRRGMRHLWHPARYVAAGGAVVSAALLIADLGRPARFVNMLRVFRPSSPMNMGSWLLSAFGACAAAALLPGRLGDAGAVGAGIFGVPLTSYTGVLLAGTAVPIWQGARRSLPVLFSASGAAAAASLFDLLPARDRGAVAMHRIGTVAKAAELALSAALELEAARAPRVAIPLRGGASGLLWRASQLCTAASLALSLGKRRRISGVLGTLGSLALRFALLAAGRRSARDPRAAFGQQRAQELEPRKADPLTAHAEAHP